MQHVSYFSIVSYVYAAPIHDQNKGYLTTGKPVQDMYAAIICHNDELSLSLSWLDCLLTDSEVFILQ